MGIQKKSQLLDRRRFERRPLQYTVSFSLKNGRGHSFWYLGKIKDAGMAGMKISCRQFLKLDKGQKMMILCPIDGGTPVWIGAKVAWFNDDERSFGLSYL